MQKIDSGIENRLFYKKLLTIALPIAVQSLITSSLSLVDNIMVGNLGEVEMTAVGAAVQIFFIHWMFLFGFNSGTATFTAQFWGVRDLKNIRKTIGFAFRVSFIVGVLCTITANLIPESLISIFTEDKEAITMGAKYLRITSPVFILLSVSQPFTVALKATQQTKLPLIVSFVSFSTNTFLNYVLIFGAFGAPRLETAGAAVATLIARTVECGLFIYIVFGKKNIIAGKLKEFRGGSTYFLLKITRNAVPTTLNELIWGGGHAAYMAAIGHISTTAYAAASAANTIENLFIMAGFSIGDAALILLGEKLGENRIDEAIAMSKKLVKAALVIGVICGALLILLSKAIIGFYGFSEEGREYALKILFIYGIFLVSNLYNGTIITGVLRGGGDTKFAALAESGTVWLIGVPLVFMAALVWKLPVYLVVLCSKAEEITKCIILTYRFLSKKWANNMIIGMDEE